MIHFFKKRSLHSTQRIERTRKRFFSFFLFFLILVVSGTALVSWGSHRKEISISSIKIIGAESISSKSIKEIALKSLDGRYWKLFSRASSLIYPRKQIEKKIFETFPRVASVAVFLDELRELVIEIEEREPTYLWCGEKISLNENVKPQCYFIDPEGIIFTKSPYFSGNVYFEMYGKISGTNIYNNPTSPPLGFFFLKSENFMRVVAFKNELASSGMRAEKFILEEKGDVAFVFPSGTELLLNFSQDFGMVLYNLLAAFDTESINKEMLYEL